MNRPRPPRFGAGFEHLESREVPAVYGLPWADSGHLTLSFVPDGTATPNGPSTLFRTMNGVATSSMWQREILRAVQTWASEVNVDVGVVADDGSPLGAVGAVQGDRRFGDIRIAAVPLVDSSELASASPFSWTGTTFSGDIVFDSSRPFRIGNNSLAGFDLYSVTLHEAAHVLGLEHSGDADSAIRENYRFATGLGAGDMAEVQSLYGARSPDAFDAVRANNTAASAVAIPRDSALANRFTAKADLGANDTDWFKFTVPLVTGITGVSVRTTMDGSSLLTPQVTVYNAAGKVVATGRSLDPASNDLALQFSSTLLGGAYTVKVNAAGSDFKIGGYQLTIDFLSLGTILAPVTNLLAPVLDSHSNDSLSLATLLAPQSRSAPDARFDYAFRGVIEDRTDTDNYRIRAENGVANLNVIVWGLDADALDPAVHVFDAAGKPVGFQVLANDRGVFSLQIPSVNGGQDYFVQIAARTAGDTGAYFLGADFGTSAPTAFDLLSAGEIESGTRTDALVVGQASLYNFAISAAGAGAGVKLSVLDAAGREVLTLTATAGEPTATRIAYLRDGTYSIRYSVLGPRPVRFFAEMLTITDPVGPYASTTTSTSPDNSSGTNSTPPEDNGYTYSSSSTTTSSGSWYSF